MPHKFRGKEKYNPNKGVDLNIKKINPGSEEAEGYEVDVYIDKGFVETIKTKSKKQVMEIIRQYKDQYGTDRAFVNEMKVFITYKQRERDAGMITDAILYRKANEIEKKLIKMFNPDTPVVRHAEEVEPEPQATPSATTTQDIISKSIELVRKFISDNTGIIESEDPSKAYNALMSWVYKLKENIDKEIASGADYDVSAIVDALNKEFGSYDFLQERRTASDLVINIEENDGGIDISTDDAIEKLIDSLNDLSGATVGEINSANSISNAVSNEVKRDILSGTYELYNRITKLQHELLDFIQTSRFSGELDDAIAFWVARRGGVSIKEATLIRDFISIDLNNNVSDTHKFLAKFAASYTKTFIDNITDYLVELTSKIETSANGIVSEVKNVVGFVWSDFEDIIREWITTTDSFNVGIIEYALENMRYAYYRDVKTYKKVRVTDENESIQVFYSQDNDPSRMETVASDFFSKLTAELNEITIVLSTGKEIILGESLKKPDSNFVKSFEPDFSTVLLRGLDYINESNVERAIDPKRESTIDTTNLAITEDKKFVVWVDSPEVADPQMGASESSGEVAV